MHFILFGVGLYSHLLVLGNPPDGVRNHGLINTECQCRRWTVVTCTQDVRPTCTQPNYDPS